MKKVSLLSLLAVLTITTGAKANIESPIWMPTEGTVYSKTEIADQDSNLLIKQKFGYGINNKFEINGLVAYEDYDKGDNGFAAFSIGAKYRYMNAGVIGDVYFNYESNMDKDVRGDFDQQTLGTVIGQKIDSWTTAGKVEYRHLDADDDHNQFVIGWNNLYQFTQTVSANFDLDYEILDEDGTDDPLYLTAQVNFNTTGGIVSTFLKTDLTGDMEDMFGLKYGVQF